MTDLLIDDLSGPYQRHRAQAPATSAAEQLLQRVRSAPKPKKEGGPAAPATAPATPEEGDGSAVGRVAKDIGVGVVETPRAVVKGIRDYLHNVGELGRDIEGWLNLPGIKVSKGGIEIVSGKELQGLERPQLPDLAAPKTVTGSIVKGISQFIAGFSGAGKIITGGGAVATAGKGAVANFAAFDPHQQRLSNLIEKVPALKNPVTAYLASDPDDSDAEGRFKNAVEGLGLGLLTDGFVKGVRLLREVNKGKAAAQTAQGEAMAAAGKAGLADDAFKELGDSADDVLVKRVSAKPLPAGQGGGVTGVIQKATGKAPDDDVFINFARIDTTDDVKRTMQALANEQKKAIAAGGRGSRSFAQTKLDAEQVDAWKVLSSRRVGEPLNAEQSVAARELWVTTSDRLSKMAQAAADAPSEANLFAFRKMLSVHELVQREVIAARTETARALGSWRIPAGSSAERLRDVTQALDASGGAAVTRELAKRIAVAARIGPQELNGVVEMTARATTMDAVMEGWINGLLSNPTTHVVNTVSNSSVMFLRMGERATAAKIAALLGDDASVQAGEATAQFFGMTSGIKDAFRYAAKAARTGESGMGLGKLEVPRPGAFGAEAFGLSSSGWLGRGADLTGQVIRVPGRALVAEDEFFKTLGYRMELHSQALRQAAGEVHTGKIAESAFKQRIAEIVANPPENVRLAAVDSAVYQTFTNAPGKIAQSLSKLTNSYPALKVLMPFTRTPANILTFTFERTPLAPLMSKFRANIAAGGARRDLALAQMGLGTMGMFAFADATMSGQVSGRGPLEKGQRDALMRSGWLPYSIKVGDSWYAYNRLDPVGSLMGMAADATETMMHAQHEALDDPDTEKLAVAATIAFAGNLVNKTYLSGISSVIEALNDPTRSAESWAQRLAGSLVPAVVAAIERSTDPQVTEVNSMIEAIRARIPGLSDQMPVRRNLWGEPLQSTSGKGAAFDLLSPARTNPSEMEPIDREIIDQGLNITMPSRRTSFNGVNIDLGQFPGAYSRYLQLAGNELKHPAWGMGAKDLLNAVVEGKHPLSAVYQIRSGGPDGGRDVFIRETLQKYREMARRQLLDEFPELAEQAAVKQENARALRMPVQLQ